MPSMIARSPAALGLLLVLACQGAAVAEDPNDPFLPRCAPAHETRVPVPTWDQDSSTLLGLRRLMSHRSPGTKRVVYATFGALEDETEIGKEGTGYSVKMIFEGKRAEAGEVTISAFERPQFNMGYYVYEGFFEVSVPSSPTSEVALRRLDTFDVVSSGLYCLGNGPSRVAPRQGPAHQAPPSGSLPACRPLHDSRIPIATWKPKLKQTDTGSEVHLAPPMGNGRIVYISIEDPKWPCGAVESNNGLYSVSLPNGPGAVWPGMAINLRGNTTAVGTGCRYEGFFMNEPVQGMHQGWIETYFGAIDRERIVASNQYCVARQR